MLLNRPRTPERQNALGSRPLRTHVVTGIYALLIRSSPDYKVGWQLARGGEGEVILRSRGPTPFRHRVLAVAIYALTVVSTGAARAAEPFTVIVLPDTQNYT